MDPCIYGEQSFNNATKAVGWRKESLCSGARKKNNFGTVYDIPKSTQNTSQIVVVQSLEMRQCECESSNFVFFEVVSLS